MNRISARPGHVGRHAQMRKVDSCPTRPSLRIRRALPRIAAGATAALAAVSAALCVFGPLSDQRALQFAAGSGAKAPRSDAQPLESAATGRSSGSQAQRHADAESVTSSPLDVGPALDTTSHARIAK
jgi:hypothetical protein